MGISREEIEAIADKVAERVVSKRSICDCGFFAWHRKTDFDILEQATNTQNAEWVKLTVPHVKDALGDLEQACRIDLAEAKVNLDSYGDFVKSASWDKARAAALAIKGKVSNQLYLCSRGEEQG